MPERVAQLLAFGRVVGERPRKPALAFVSQADVRDATVDTRRFARYQTYFLSPADELGDGRLRELKAICELGDGGALVSVGSAFDHQEQKVALRSQPRGPRDPFAPAEESAQRRAEFGDGDDVADSGPRSSRLHAAIVGR